MTALPNSFGLIASFGVWVEEELRKIIWADLSGLIRLGSTVHIDGCQNYSNDQTSEAEECSGWWKPSANHLPHQNHDNKSTDDTGTYPGKRPPHGAGVVNKEGYNPDYYERGNKEWNRFVGINPMIQVLRDEFHGCKLGDSLLVITSISIVYCSATCGIANC